MSDAIASFGLAAGALGFGFCIGIIALYSGGMVL